MYMFFQSSQFLSNGVEVDIYYKVILLDDVFGIDGNIFIWGFVSNNFYCLVIMKDYFSRLCFCLLVLFKVQNRIHFVRKSLPYWVKA